MNLFAETSTFYYEYSPWNTKSRISYTNYIYTVDDLVLQGAKASANILNTTLPLIFSASVLKVLHCSWLIFLYIYCIFQIITKKNDNEKIRIAQPRRPRFK